MNKKKQEKEMQNKLTEQVYSKEHLAVSAYLRKLRFKPRFFGVDQADVWKHIEKLCELYEYAVTTERLKVEKLQEELEALRGNADIEQKEQEDESNG